MILTDPNNFLGSASSVTVLITMFAILSCGLLAISVSSRLARVATIVPAVVFFWYLCVGIGAFYILGPYSLSPDGITYDRQAVDVASRFGLEVPYYFESPLHTGKWGFPVLLGGLYSIVGRMPLAGVLINCLIVSLTVIVILATSRKISTGYHPWFVLAYFMVSPAFVTLGPSLMREALSWLGLSLAVFFSVTLIQGQNLLWGGIAGATSTVILISVRTSLGMLTIGSLAGAILGVILWRRWRGPGLVRLLVLTIVLMLLIGDSFLQLAGFDTATLVANRDYLSRSATTGFDVFLGPFSHFGLAGLVLATLPNVLFGPFPWDIGPALVWGWVVANSMLWWVALWRVFRMRKRFPAENVYIALVIFAFVLLMGLSAYLTNYGILARLRALPLVVFLVIMSVSVPERDTEREGAAA